ncbi:MAG: Arm DNA-binding domain-containing protein, partial [Thermodesulfobacteriota bacterium]|nr:Arm DNA-binding domain-containing protein [Thermodesulfobacteriota bacterium]
MAHNFRYVPFPSWITENMPKLQFSDLKIKNIKYNGKQTEYSDSTKLRGVKGYLCLLVGKNSKAFAVRYRVQGKRKRFALGSYPDLKLKQARVDAVALLVKVNDGFDPALGKKEYREAETFADLWEQYIKSPSFKAKVPETQKEDHRRYDKRLKQPLGDIKLIDIRKKHLSAILSPLAEKAP